MEDADHAVNASTVDPQEQHLSNNGKMTDLLSGEEGNETGYVDSLANDDTPELPVVSLLHFVSHLC
jgi:hypothetical protein